MKKVGKLQWSQKWRQKQCKQASLQPKKNNYLRAQAKKANLERTRGSCSSEKEHKVNALAPRAEEGRDNLR